MRILLNVERGFIEPISYKTENEQFARNGGNIGNKIFSQAIYNMLNVPENTIEFVELNDQLEILNFTPEEINEQFDVFIFATVIFGTDYIMRRNIQTYTKIVEGLKIPVFCFSVGTQISSYDQMEDLVNGTKDVAVPFINSVVKANGYMALRGYFTAEFFKRLGFNEFEVTGCPSMYQNGYGYKLEKDIVSPGDFQLSLNGNTGFLRTEFVRRTMNNYKTANYLDQDQFVELIYGKNVVANRLKEYCGLIKKYSLEGLQLFADDRVRLICNFSEWKDYFTSNNISFSFGSRIHGNIIAILSGVPGMVCYCDSRTREMAEFFNIPLLDICDLNKKDIYNLYVETDYSKFNREYDEKIRKLDSVLSEFGLPHDMDYNKGGSETEIKEHYYDFENHANKDTIHRMLKEHRWFVENTGAIIDYLARR